MQAVTAVFASEVVTLSLDTILAKYSFVSVSSVTLLKSYLIKNVSVTEYRSTVSFSILIKRFTISKNHRMLRLPIVIYKRGCDSVTL